MKILDLAGVRCERIESFGSVHASAAALAFGGGAAHAYVVRFEPGGSIGPHPAGYGQLFIAIEGEGWAAGLDGVRHPLRAGFAAHFTRGEVHSKGSETGMAAVMVQVKDLHPSEQGAAATDARE